MKSKMPVGRLVEVAIIYVSIFTIYRFKEWIGSGLAVDWQWIDPQRSRSGSTRKKSKYSASLEKIARKYIGADIKTGIQ